MNFNLASNLEKKEVFEKIADLLKKENFTVIKQDETRPWGGFFVIDESQAKSFAAKFSPILKCRKSRLPVS